MSVPRGERRSGSTPGSVVPPNWQIAPPDPNWNGKRFVSPDGASWFAAYTAPADEASNAAHMKSIAFVEGETLTYLRGERNWIAVAGFKGSRFFFRKAAVACAGTTWKHIAYEYPAELRIEMERFLISATRAFDNDQSGCAAGVASKER
jgi:hypothetical protein